MTIKNLKKNVSAEKDYIITDVQDNASGMLTFTLRRLYYDSDAVDSQGQSLSQKTIQIDLSKHKLKLFKFSSREEGLEVLEALKEGEDIPAPYTELDKESHIFLLPKNTNDEGSYQEFMWVDNDFEIIGSTDIDLEPYFLKANVHNALDYSTNDGVKALSAYQGYVLNTTKFNKSDVANNLTTSTDNASKALSAYQGYLLNENKINKNDIVDNLTTNDNTKVLSAKQGKALEDKKLDKTDVIDSLNSEETTKPLSANQGRELDILIRKCDDKADENEQQINSLINDLDSIDNSIRSLQSDKVDKVTGKGLSTNDFTTAEKNKLDSLQNITVVDSVTDGNSNPVTSNAVYDYIQNIIGTIDSWLTS